MSKKIAAALKAFSEAADELAAAFSSAGGADGGGDDDEGTGKPKSSATRSKTKVAKGKPAESDGPDEDTVREKMKELVEAKGKDALLEAFAAVGAGKLADVDESQYQELIDKAQELIDAEEEEEEKPAKKTAAKGKTKAVTQKQVLAAAKALLEADAAIYKKVCKKLGVAKASEVEEDDFGTALAAFEAAMPEEEEEAEL